MKSVCFLLISLMSLSLCARHLLKKVFKGIGIGCDEEAIRIVNLTWREWIPGSYRGNQQVALWSYPSPSSSGEKHEYHPG
jgi:hypothetical protein